MIAQPGRSPKVRLDLADVFAEIRDRLRRDALDLVIDCHPYTISQRDGSYASLPLLTLTSKVLAGELAPQRYAVAPTIGLGWWASHRILTGREEALHPFRSPPQRTEAWLLGVYEALSHYRNVLDHLPWALDSRRDAPRLLEESCRYAEEALRDGVHIALTSGELAMGHNIEILRDWATVGESFYAERYGEAGSWACETIRGLKERLGETCTPSAAADAWEDSLRVWSLVWDRYLSLARQHCLAKELHQVTAWL